MTDHEEQEKGERKSLGGDLILPIGAFIFTLYYFYTIIDVPRIAQVSAFFVGTILIFFDTMNKVYGDPAYEKVLKKTKVPMALFTKSWSQAGIDKYVKDITAIGEKYKDLLTGKS